MPVPSSAARLAKSSDGSAEPDYRLEDQVGHLMRRTHQRHAALFQEIMGGIDLTPTQFAALVKIRDEGEVTQNQLGRLTAMDPATIQGVVQRLLLRELVVRRADPADRRMTILSLTPAGTRLARDAVARARDITRATLAPLSAAEQSQLIDLLRKLS